MDAGSISWAVVMMSPQSKECRLAAALCRALDVPLRICQDRGMPAAGRDDGLTYFRRAPGSRLVLENRGIGAQDRIDDSPCFFHVVLAREEGGVAGDGIAEHA